MRRRASILVVLVAAIASLASGPDAGAAVYWGGGSSVGAANLDGSVPIFGYPYSIANAFRIGTVCGVAVDASHLFWADRYKGTIGRVGQPPGTVTDRVDIVGEPLQADEALVSGLASPCGLALDGAHLYWADQSGMAIGRADLDGGAQVRNLVSAVSLPCGVAVDGTHVYWASLTGDAIGRARLDGSEVEREFIGGAHGPCGVAVDGAHVYWANQLGGSIGRADLDGGNPDQGFIAGLTDPCGVAVDGAHVYWANWNGRDPVGRANLDGSAVETSLVSTEFYLASCGVALDSKLFKPAPPPPSAPFFLGRVRRGRGGVAYVTVKVPAAGGGELRVLGKGLAWGLPGSPQREGGYILRQLKLWPGRGSRAARRIRRTLRRRGRVHLLLEVTYQEAGRSPALQVRELTLLRRPPRHSRRPT